MFFLYTALNRGDIFCQYGSSLFAIDAHGLQDK